MAAREPRFRLPKLRFQKRLRQGEKSPISAKNHFVNENNNLDNGCLSIAIN